MGMITITVDAGAAGIMTRQFNVTNANIGRLAAFAKTVAGPGLPGSPEMTNAEALEAWAKWVMQQTKAQVIHSERRAAAVPDFGVD